MNLDEAMYTFGTGENFHLQNYLGVHELEGEEGFVFRVWAPHAEQIQVIGDIFFLIKGIFGQKHGKLGLNPEAGAKGLLKQVIVAQGFFGVVIEKHGIQDELIFCGEMAVTEAFKLFFVLGADLICIFHICGNSTKRSFFS